MGGEECCGAGKAGIITKKPQGGGFPEGWGRCRYFCDKTHFTRVLMSASETVEFGGIGTWPQTPTPPFFTLSTSFASAALSPLYLAATSLKAGPTIFLSTAWQAVQALFCASAISSAAKAGAAATASAAAARIDTLFMCDSLRRSLISPRLWANRAIFAIRPANRSAAGR